MNLIEQLGGYETLKREYEETLPLIQKGYKSKSMEVIRLSLLEYRRQHNIFEVGDLIIDACIGNSVIKYHGGYDNHENWVSCFVRHATPAEIKAGRRLPVIESDDCSDIRNHISPNTVVINHAT